uniref:Uncharacterized protein n=1 Tax=Rhizophora mucronata TaxID=61149 RepID=A0A2P2JRE9_RHIMU
MTTEDSHYGTLQSFPISRQGLKDVHLRLDNSNHTYLRRHIYKNVILDEKLEQFLHIFYRFLNQIHLKLSPGHEEEHPNFVPAHDLLCHNGNWLLRIEQNCHQHDKTVAPVKNCHFYIFQLATFVQNPESCV